MPTTMVVVSPYTDVSVLGLTVCFLSGRGGVQIEEWLTEKLRVLILRTEAVLIRRILRF